VAVKIGILHRATAAVVVLTAATGFGACSSSDSGESVDVSLVDYQVIPKAKSVPAGDVTFKITNNGTFVHELVVDKAADASKLPVTSSGEVNEDAISDADHVGEVEDLDPGETEELKVTLDAGDYVLFCNRVDGDIVHFEKGMHADFTVTPD
jgi:uncharacterized cupredoxin-like copper-binding protein